MLLDLDRNAPRTLRAAAILVPVGSLAYGGLLLVGGLGQIVNVLLLLLVAYAAVRRIPRIERWEYWLNAVLLAPAALAFLGVMVLSEIEGWLAGGGVLLAYRVLGWVAALCYASASFLCLLPPSKRAADAARTLNGVPVA